MNPRSIAAPYHGRLRSVLRIVGPGLLITGVLFIVVGMADFFSSFGSFAPPRLFWCCFVGMPLVFAGALCCGIGFMGATARYAAAETAPVTADTFNYLAGETRGGVKVVAAAVAESLRSDAPAPSGSVEERLKRLEAMKATALITEAEYQQQRQRILAAI